MSQHCESEILRLHHIAYSRNSQAVLKDVCFSVKEDESVALLGANGAGKSTLLRICSGLLKPQSGTVLTRGEAVDQNRSNYVRCLGFVFQRHQLVPHASVLANVIHGRMGFPEGWRCCWQVTAPNWVRERAMECLDEVGLAHKAMQQARTLSGGESQRVAIARVLIRDPALILADEPTASLDPAAGDEVLQLLKNLSLKHRTAVLLATHDIHRVMAYADRILGLRDGCITIDSPTAGLSPGEIADLYRRSAPDQTELKP